MKKIFLLLTLLASTAFSATEQPQEIAWKHSCKGRTDTYTCRGIKGAFSASLKHEGQPIIKKGKAFTISITTCSNANTPHKGFANEFGTALLATGDPYADPMSNAGDNAFGLYVGSGQDAWTWMKHDQRKVELHINNANNAVSNYVLNHKNDSYKNTLTLSFTLKYTPAKEGNKSKMVLTANKGSDVTFDPLTVEDISTSVLFKRLQNGGTVTPPVGTKTDIMITTECERMVITTSQYILAGLGVAALIILCMAFNAGKPKKKH